MDTEEIKAALLMLGESDERNKRLIGKIISAMEVQNENLDRLMRILEKQQQTIDLLSTNVAVIAPFCPKMN